MVLGYHVIFGAYGFWLPNDPRGSWSAFVGSWELLRFGPATKTAETRSVARNDHDHHARLAAKAALKCPAVRFSEPQVEAVAAGFDRARQEGHYRICACSILPEHVHLIIARHERNLGRIVGHLKTRATQRLLANRLWPEDRRPVWADRAWKVYLDSAEGVARAIDYVNQNPLKEGRPLQHWPFVEPWAD